MTTQKHPGRPLIAMHLKKIPVAYRLPRWLVEWMRAQPEAAAVIIENAVTEKHGLVPHRSGEASRCDLSHSYPRHTQVICTSPYAIHEYGERPCEGDYPDWCPLIVEVCTDSE